MPSIYDGQLLNFNAYVIFTGYHGTNDTLGKVIVYDEPGKSRSYKPNQTATFVAYLLCRDNWDYILYDDMKQKLTDKFNNFSENDLVNFLNDLNNNLELLDVQEITSEIKPSGDPDPSNVCKGTKLNWALPTLTADAKKLKVKGDHAYSEGYFFITWWR